MKKKLAIIVILSGLTLSTLHIINRVITKANTIKNLLTNRIKNFYSWRFGKVHYRRIGNGRPILLIHDLTAGSCGYEFDRLENALAKTNEVYTLDLIGYGLSEKPNITYTNFLYVELITDFIKFVIGKKTDVITSGDSSSIALMACNNNTEIINRIVMINPQDLNQAKRIPDNKDKLLKLMIELPIVGTFIYNIIYNRKTISNYFLNDYYYHAGNIKETDISAYEQAVHYPDHTGKYAIASYMSHYTNISITHALLRIDNSIFIISGMKKKNAGSITEQYIKYNHAIEHHYVSDTKQLPHMEDPQKTTDIIRMILDI